MKKLEPLITKSSSDTWDISHSIAEELKKGNEYEKWLGQFLRDIYNNVFGYKWSGLAQDRDRMIKDMKNGCKYSGGVADESYECGTNYWIFDGVMSDDDIRKALDDMGIFGYNDRGIYDEMDWDCSGKCLSSEPWIQKRTKTRVLVTQGWSYDV